MILGNGDGSLKAPVTYPVGVAPAMMALADFNGDSKLDLAIPNIGNDLVSVLLGNGDGTFQPAFNYRAGHSPVSAAAGDLNNDGASDLAITNADSVTLTVMLNIHGTVASLTSSRNPSSVGKAITFTADVHASVRGSQMQGTRLTAL